MANEKLSLLKLNEKDRKQYDFYMEDVSFNKLVFRTAKVDGYYEGLEAGRESGLEEGRLSGIAEKARETARKMKLDGLKIELITSYTGLSKEEIEQL